MSKSRKSNSRSQRSSKRINKNQTRVQGHFRSNRNGSKTWVKTHIRNQPTKHVSSKNIAVLHDNKKDWHTTRSHKFAKDINELSEYNSMYDRLKWDLGEKTSSTETDRREREIIRDSDMVVRVVPPSSKTGKRNEGAQRELRKAINSSKPIIEIFERDARDSPNRPVQEKNYHKLVQIHLKSGEHLTSGFRRGIKELKRKEII